MNGQSKTIGRSMIDTHSEARILFMRPGSLGMDSERETNSLGGQAISRAQALARAGIRFGGQPSYGEATAELTLES